MMADGSAREPVIGRFRQMIAAMLCAPTMWYFRCPGAPGRRWLWRRWVEPYLAWRRLTLPARAMYGQRMISEFPSIIDTRIYFLGVWEPAISSYFSSILKPGDTFIDIGAHTGYHSLLAAGKVGPTGRVYAFEASPGIFARLQRNLALNDAGNVIARNVAVTHQRIKVPVFGHENAPGRTTILETEADKIGAALESTVDGFPLVDLLDPAVICSAKVIKIDVEGAEWLVLSGLRALIPLLSPQTQLLIEFDEDAAQALGGSFADLLDMLTPAGFSVFEIPNSYAVEHYMTPQKPVLTPYDGQRFRHKDFIVRKKGAVAE
jgi:FkbM family methyltransferase